MTSPTVDELFDLARDYRQRLRVAVGQPKNAVRRPAPWFEFRNQASDPAIAPDETDIYLYDVIGGWCGITAQDFVAALQAVESPVVNVHINSPGGDVFDGIAIFQALRNHKARIVTYVDSLAASAASFIAMAGDKRIIAPYGTLMIHDAWGMCVGNAAEMDKMRDELDRLSGIIASIYADRGTGGNRDDWRAAMHDETWYSAAEAVAAGLMHEQQADEEKGADAPAAAASNRWDLSVFNFAGRDKAPAPWMPGGVHRSAAVLNKAAPKHTTATSDKPWDAAANEKRIPDDASEATLRDMYAWLPATDPGKAACKLPHHEVSTDGVPGAANMAGCRSAIAALNGARGGVDIPAADREPTWAHLAKHLRDGGEEPPELNDSVEAETSASQTTGAEPEESITEPTKESPVATLSTDVLSRLGLDDSADDAAVLARIDDLTAKAETPARPEPDPAAEAVLQAQADENAELRKTVDLLSAKVGDMSAELAATKAEKAAAEKVRVLDEAQRQGKFAPADRAQWETDYDEAPAAVTRMLARIAEGAAVPVAAHGHAGGEDGSIDAEYEAIVARIDGPLAKKGN